MYDELEARFSVSQYWGNLIRQHDELEHEAYIFVKRVLCLNAIFEAST